MQFEAQRQKDVAAKLASVIASISSIDPSKLMRAELGLNFQEYRPFFEAIRESFQSVAMFDWLQIPQTGQLDTLYNMAQQVQGHLKEIEAFNANSNDAFSQRQQLIDRLGGRWSEFFDAASRQIPFQMSRAAGLGNAQTRIETAVNNAEKAINEALQKVESYGNEAKQVLDRINSAAAAVGVAQESIHFARNASEYRRQSFWWLGAAIFAACVTCFTAYFILAKEAAAPNAQNEQRTPNVAPADAGTVRITTALIQKLSGRVVIISILITAVFFTIRNYSACCHNHILNEHRALSLSTFQTFVAGTSDPKTKDSILLQAAQAAFSVQPSGYLKTDSESPQVNPVTNIISKEV